VVEISGAGLTGGVRSNLAGEGFKIADGFVDVHAEPDRASARNAANIVAEEAEGEANRSGARRFFAALFTPNPNILMALRTGIPTVLSSPIGIAALTLGGLFAASFVGAIVAGLSIGALGAAFIGIGAFALRENEKIVKAFETTKNTISEGLKTAAAPLIPAFVDAFSTISNIFKNQVQPLLLNIFTGLAPIIQPLVQAVGDGIVTFLSMIGDPAVLQPLVDFFITLAPLIPQLAESFGQFFVTLSENAPIIADAFGIAIDIIGRVIEIAAGFLVGLSLTLIEIKKRWDQMWDNVKTAANNFRNFIKGVADNVRSIWNTAIANVNERINTIRSVVSAVVGYIGGVWATIKAKIINPIRDGISNAIMWVRGLPGRAAAAIGDLGSRLYTKGRALIQGFVDGIKSMIGAVASAVSAAVQTALPFLPGSPVKRGPLTVFNQLSTNPGAKLAKMLADGFNTQMQAFTPALAGVGNVTVNPSIANPPVSIRVYLDGREITPTVNAIIDERDLQIKRAVTSGGLRLP
jgi:phage-related protein